VPISYSEPAVLWRLHHRDEGHARATIIPGVPTSTLVLFLNDKFERGENFEEWGAALARAEQIRRQLIEAGWTPEE
jgi:hypothetical protein